MPAKKLKFSVEDTFDHLLKVFKSKRFLHKEGLGNEVPFFICDYSVSESEAIANLQKQLIRKLSQSNISVLEINLYDLSIEMLQERGLLEQILSSEQRVSKGQLKELLQGVLDTETHLIPEIAKKMGTAEFNIMFLTGIGEIFPYIRSHNILNNLQSTAKSKPTVMFFPGEYRQSLGKGASLILFGKLTDDKYYRAFRLSDYEV